jgi:S1-C subfamily serine protease
VSENLVDAVTTNGGSGGPVLDINADAVAINTAIIPKYGDANFGVPVEYARRLLPAAGIEL